MAMENKNIFLAMGVIALFLVSMLFTQSYNATRHAKEQKQRAAYLGKVQFKGKVTGIKTYRYFGKNYYQVCVKLDTTTADTLNIYNELDCIRIKNDRATFSAGYLNPVLGAADSIAANIDNSGKVVFHYRAHAIETRPFGFDPMGLKRSDLDWCN
jgi:hypothetical protein